MPNPYCCSCGSHGTCVRYPCTKARQPCRDCTAGGLGHCKNGSPVTTSRSVPAPPFTATSESFPPIPQSQPETSPSTTTSRNNSLIVPCSHFFSKVLDVQIEKRQWQPSQPGEDQDFSSTNVSTRGMTRATPGRNTRTQSLDEFLREAQASTGIPLLRSAVDGCLS